MQLANHLTRAAALLALLFANIALAVGPAGTPLAGFTDTLVTSVSSPTALAFTPDGRMLITSQTGQLRVYQNGALVTAPALDLTVGDTICNNFERGLLGVAVDPDFASNHYIYLYYTFKKFGTCVQNDPTNPNVPVNRVARYTLSDGNQATGETVLIDNILSANGNHNAGDLHFGKDGYLYISVGDGGADYAGNSGGGGSNDAARDQFILLGKILRIRSDGTLPPDNPWMGSDSARCYDPAPGGNKTGRNADGKKCQETFAWGLRNPFRMAFDSNAASTRFFINDVGQGQWEEIDEGLKGADYGWNAREGHCVNGSTSNCGAPPAGMTNPIFDYGRGDGCAAITGGAFVPSGLWPAEYDGLYLFGDYTCGKIFKLTPDGGGYMRSDFVTSAGGVTAMTFGPYNATQALYYTANGQVRRVVYTGSANRTPIADLKANPSSGPAPLSVTLDGSGSSDLDAGDTLTYLWDFGDQAPDTETSTATITHVYTPTGTYTATLRVRDNHGALSAPASVRIDVGNTAPEPMIMAPAANARFRVGQTIALQGHAFDAEDGALPASALSWTVTLHHNEHTHPYLPPTPGDDITFTAPGPEDLAATAGSYLEIALTATDLQGLSTTITQTLQPNRVNVTFTTVPAGLQLIVNDTSITAPQTLVSWEGYTLNSVAPIQLDGAGGWLRLQQWSDGGLPNHPIITPATPMTYTATFTPTQPLLLPLIRR